MSLTCYRVVSGLSTAVDLPPSTTTISWLYVTDWCLAAQDSETLQPPVDLIGNMMVVGVLGIKVYIRWFQLETLLRQKD